ncbi:unnamed protein product [Gadus morhua 'NCC']
MQGKPQEESQDIPAPQATAQCGPYSLMFRPKGVIVLSSAIHLCSAAFLCLSAQHAFISSPVMNSEYGEFLCNRAGGGGVLVPDDHRLLKMASVLRGGASNIRGEAGRHKDILPGLWSGPLRGGIYRRGRRSRVPVMLSLGWQWANAVRTTGYAVSA